MTGVGRSRRTGLAVWWQAVRPHSLGAAVGPVLLAAGAAAAAGRLRPLWLPIVLAGALLLQIGTNLCNDYYDFVQGADPPLGGGPRPLQAGLLAPRAVRRAGMAALAAALALGAALVVSGRPWLPAFAAGGALLGWAYTAPPLRLGYRGLGEVVVFLAMGPAMVAGAAYALTGSWLASAVWLSLPTAFLVTAVLHANNLRDRERDRETGKRTLAVRLGPTWARRELALLVLGCYAAAVALVAAGRLPWPTLLVLLTAPQARPVLTAEPARAMRLLARLQLACSVLLALGEAVAR